MDQGSVDEEAIGSSVLGQGQRLVSMSGLSLHPLQDTLSIRSGSNSYDIRPSHVQEGFEMMRTVDFDRSAWILGPRGRHCHCPFGVGVIAQTDKELSTGEEDIRSGEEGIGRRGFDHSLIQLFFENCLDIVDLLTSNKSIKHCSR